MSHFLVDNKTDQTPGYQSSSFILTEGVIVFSYMFQDNCIKKPKGHVENAHSQLLPGLTEEKYLEVGCTSEFLTGYRGILMYTKFWNK